MTGIAIVLCAYAAAQVDVDQAALAPAHNLISNCSFEAQDKGGRPLGWDLYAQPQCFSLSSDAAHGSRSLRANAPAGIRAHTAARQWVRASAGQELELSAWIKVKRTDGQPVRIYLQFYDQAGQRLSTAHAQWSGKLGEWLRLTVRARAPDATARAAALVPYLFGAADVLADAVRLGPPRGGRVQRPSHRLENLRAVMRRPNWIRISWDSNADNHLVRWRTLGVRGASWNKAEYVREHTYSIVPLRPQTRYQIQVQTVADAFYDLNGKPVQVVSTAQSHPIEATTEPLAPRRWAGFKLWPTTHLNTFPDGTAYPCIEVHNDSFFIVEMRNNELYLSKVRPRDLKPEWTKLVIERVPGCYQGIPDTCIQGDRLWITWNRQATGKPDYHITQSRQLLTYWDLKSDTRGPVITIEPTRPGLGTWEGGVDVLRGQLWVTWLEVWTEDGRRRTNIVAAPYDPEEGFGQPAIWRDCPTVYPYGPSISPIDGELALVFSDLAALEKRQQTEPLLWTLFDGERFHGTRVLRSLGRNRYAKGVRVGRSFLMAYKCNARWMEWGYMFHDIALTKLGPAPGDMTTCYYVDDMKYNSSPDMTVYNGQVYLVYTKFEHAYGRKNDPAKLYGTFIGRIEPEVK